MSQHRSTLTLSTITPSRRGLLRLAAAGAVVTAVGRQTPVVRAQTPFPSRVQLLHASPELGKVEVHLNGLD